MQGRGLVQGLSHLHPFGLGMVWLGDHRHAHGFAKRIQSPYFATGNPETEEMTSLYAPGMLGCVCDFDQGGLAGPPNVCSYQLVKQAAAITGIVGNLMYWSNKGLFTATTANASRAQGAGVCRIAAATAASYIWVAKKGDRGVLFVGAPTSAPDANGKPVVSSATDGSADCLALATAPNVALWGNTLSVTAANIATVRLNVPDTF